MTSSESNAQASGEQVLVLTSRSRSAELACSALHGDGLSAAAVDLDQFCAKLDQSPCVGVVADDLAPSPDAWASLVGALRQQPAWSCAPLVMLARRGKALADAARLLRRYEDAVQALLLECPLPRNIFLAAVRAALAMRRRQLLAGRLLLAHSTRLQLLHDVSLIVNEPYALADPQPRILKRLCAGLGARAGHIFHLNDRGAAIDSGAWHVDDAADNPTDNAADGAALVRVSRGVKFEPGQGLVGAVLQSGSVILSGELERDARFAGQPNHLGVRQLLLFPVRVGRRITGVVELFDPCQISADADLLNMFEQVGIEIGRLVERRELEHRIADLSVQEQQRIGQELHDTVGQQVAGLGMLSRHLLQKLESRRAPETPQLQNIVQYIDEAIDQIRAMARGLSISDIQAGDLERAIEELLDRTAAVHELDCRFDCPGRVDVGDDFTATQLLRIAQEAVHNAVKHSRSGKLDVALRQDEHGLALTVRDHGVGIAEDRQAGTGMGLRIMRYRAGLIGAALEIQSKPGAGAAVICRLQTPRQVEQ